MPIYIIACVSIYVFLEEKHHTFHLYSHLLTNATIHLYCKYQTI